MEEENRFERSIQELKKIIVAEKGVEFYLNLEKQLEEKEQNDFMKGYRYAIQILEESILREK